MQRIWRKASLVLLTCMLVFLAACGSSNSKSENNASTGSANTSTGSGASQENASSESS